ncbi:Lar family restriction alleviation protein [Endozoicomonas montiporae]|nr:Lar family restriction alleviation protein [Endozoicomonas montiporae]AMO55666.1 hypothetical protein EZMO1_1498 [Endozoicomonas montiporae CL-33]
MKIELKECPLCGSKAYLDRKTSAVHCSNCCTRYLASAVKYPDFDQAAIDHWNKRYFPEGCTPADARHLREANWDLAKEKEKMELLLFKFVTEYGERETEKNSDELKPVGKQRCLIMRQCMRELGIK